MRLREIQGRERWVLRGVLEGLGAGGNMDLYGLRGVEDTDGRPSGAGLIYEGGNESSA